MTDNDASRDEEAYQRDMAGDPWARAMSLEERRQEHVELLAAILGSQVTREPQFSLIAEEDRNLAACLLVAFASDIIRQNRNRSEVGQ